AAFPQRLEAAIDGAAFTARVELVHPSKPNPGLPGTPVVPFPNPARSGVFPQPPRTWRRLRLIPGAEVPD
ncbi:MAG: hypothetical protein WCF48_22740, partial [Terriglobales bacterium]